MRSLVVVLAALSICAPSAVAASPPRERQSDLSPLWRTFPLEPSTTQSVPASSPTPRFGPARPPVGARAQPGGNGRSGTFVILAAAAAAIAVFFFLAFRLPGDRRIRLLTPSTKGAPVSSFIRGRRSDDRADGEIPEPPRTRPVQIGDAVTSYSMQDGSQVESGTSAADSELPPEVSYDEFGQRVANILRVAEENAAELVEAARIEAQTIRDTAELDAQETRARLEAETAEQRSESERVRAEANKYAEDRRRTVKLEAARTQAEAEAEAKSLREAGEAIRKSLEEKGIARRQELLEASSSIEARLREALTTCHGVAAELERWLGEDEPELDEELLAEVREAKPALPEELFEEVVEVGEDPPEE